jgi:hypothetical protein
MRLIKAIGFAAILLISNIGIPVYTHICHTMARSWSSIYVPAKSCCNKGGKGMAPQNTPVNISDFPSISQRPCCENQHGFIQLQSEFIQYLPQLLSAASTYYADADVFHNFSLSLYVTESTKLSCKPHGPPLSLHGRSLLISEQVFRC